MGRGARDLRAKIDNRTAVVGVIGLGYVGLPLAIAFAQRGYTVIGFDVDQDKVGRVNQGECYIKHLGEAALTSLVADGHLSACSDFDRLAEPDALLICVPTPLTPQREPDLTFVSGTARAISDRLRPGQLVVLESTTYPGTTDELVRGILDARGLQCGTDYFLAFSPEREDPGNPEFGTTTIPKVIGGVDPVSGDLAEALYAQIIGSTVRVSNARTAEATKLVENIFRAVNIALVNELKMVYQAMGIDVWEVLDAAATKPFGFMRFNPGPGWGGHCIPLDPFYLAWKAREYGVGSRFIELAGEVNVTMPEYVIGRLQQALNELRKPVKGSQVLVLGLAYKKDIDDPRESPAFELIDRLLELGAAVRYHDPHIPVAPAMRSWSRLPSMKSVPLDIATLHESDVVLIATDHSAVDYDLVVRHASLIIDSRGVYREPRGNVVKA